MAKSSMSWQSLLEYANLTFPLWVFLCPSDKVKMPPGNRPSENPKTA